MNTKSKLTIPASDFLKDLTPKEQKIIDQEKKYYHLVVSLKKKRKQLGLTQQKLAKLAELPRTTITKVESGYRNTTLQTLMSIAQAMGSEFEIILK